jgi:hypothetical protein
MRGEERVWKGDSQVQGSGFTLLAGNVNGGEVQTNTSDSTRQRRDWTEVRLHKGFDRPAVVECHGSLAFEEWSACNR